MTNPYEKLRGGNKLAGSLNSNKITMPSPVREGVELVFRMVVVPSSEIEDKTFKCVFNHRSADHLTVGAVLDILPEIQKDKRNSHPALGCDAPNGKIEVLAGMRRRKAVSLVEDGELYILVCDSLTEEEKAAFAKTSDDYEKPSKLDIGLSMAEYKRQKSEIGEKVSQEELSALFKISTGQVSENLRFTELPTDLFSLFPSLGMISYRFLRDVLKFHKAGEAALRSVIKAAIENGMRVSVAGGETQEDLQTKCKALETELLSMLKAKPKTEKASKSVWQNIEPIEHVKVKENKSGSISVTINTNKIDKKTLDKIRKLISQ